MRTGHEKQKEVMNVKKARALGLSLALAAVVALSAAPLAWATDADPAPEASPAAAGLVEVNGVEYPSLEEAIAAIPSDKPATFKLLGDVTIPDGAKFVISNDLTVVLNGHTLTSQDGGECPINVNAGGSIVVDGTAPGSSVVIANPESLGLLNVELGADFTIKGGSYTGDTKKGALFYVAAPAAGDTKAVLEDLTVETNASVLRTSPNTIPGGSNFELVVKGGTYTNKGVLQLFYTDTIDRAPVTFEGVTATVEGGRPVIELAGSHGVFRDCNFSVTGTNANNFSDTAVFVGYMGKATIESGSYTSKGHGAYIGTSGGEIEMLGGTVQGDKGSIQADADGNSYSGAESVVTISGGTVQGNLGATTHGKAVSSFVVTGGDIAGDFVMKENGTGGDASATVSGGTFDRAIAQEYCADGFAPVQNEDGSYGVAPAAETVALVSVNGQTTGFATLEEAFASVPENATATITLIKDEDISDANQGACTVAAGVNLTLDLNGCKLSAANNAPIMSFGTLTIVDSKDVDKNGTGGGTIYATKPYGKGYSSGIMSANDGGSIVVESGLIDCASEFAPDNANKGQFGIAVMNTNADASVVINGGKIIAGWYCVSGNGNNATHNGTITVNGGELVSAADYAIYSPQKGGVTINGGSVKGACGAVHIQRDNLTVTGGTLTSTGTGNTGNWGDGTAGSGNAVVNFAGKYGNVTGEVTGGTFVAEGDAEIMHAGSTNPADVAVSGGTFNKPVPEDMLADGFGLNDPDENGNYGVHEHEWDPASIGDETGHWHPCTKCDAKDAVLPHEAAAELVGVVAATCGTDGYTGDKVCKDCGFVIEKGEVIPATGAHVADEWTTNSTDHWHVCTVCDKPFDIAAHTFGDWKVTKEATATEAGEREHACTVCGKVVTEAIPALGAGNGTGSGDQLAQTNDPAMMAVMAVGGVAIVAAIAAAVAFAMRRRSQH